MAKFSSTSDGVSTVLVSLCANNVSLLLIVSKLAGIGPALPLVPYTESQDWITSLVTGALRARRLQAPWPNTWPASLAQRRIVSTVPSTSRSGMQLTLNISTSSSSLAPWQRHCKVGNPHRCCRCCCCPCSRFACCHRACRHGDRCSRLHNKPTISQTILIPNMYQNPVLNAPLGPDGVPLPVAPEEVMEHYEVGSSMLCL